MAPIMARSCAESEKVRRVFPWFLSVYMELAAILSRIGAGSAGKIDADE
jgi:hypothetical protein